MSLITDWRLEEGGGMTNTALERETTENYSAQVEEVTPDIIWQMGDRVLQQRVIHGHPPADGLIGSGQCCHCDADVKTCFLLLFVSKFVKFLFISPILTIKCSPILFGGVSIVNLI